MNMPLPAKIRNIFGLFKYVIRRERVFFIGPSHIMIKESPKASLPAPALQEESCFVNRESGNRNIGGPIEPLISLY